MAKCKLSFWDLTIELEGNDESVEAISDRALGILTFLIPERMKLCDLEPGEESVSGSQEEPPQAKDHIIEPEQHSMKFRAYV